MLFHGLALAVVGFLDCHRGALTPRRGRVHPITGVFCATARRRTLLHWLRTPTNYPLYTTPVDTGLPLTGQAQGLARFEHASVLRLHHEKARTGRALKIK